MALDTKNDLGALGTPDPVALRDFGLLRPVNPLKIIQKLLGKGRGFEKPLGHFPLCNQRAASLALGVNHLLGSQDRFAGRAPIERGFGSVSQPGFIELNEYPLSPPIVFRRGGIHLMVPIIHVSDFLQLVLSEVLDVFRDHLGRVGARLKGEILGVHAEGIETNRFKNVIPVHMVEPALHIRSHKGKDIAHMQPFGRGIGKHHQVVKRPLGLFKIGLVDLGFIPVGSPF